MPEPMLKPLVIAELQPPLNVTVVTDATGMAELSSWIQSKRAGTAIAPEIGLDTETNITVDFWNRRIRTIQLGDKDRQFVIDLLPFAGSEEKLFESQGHYGANMNGIYRPILDVIIPVLCTDDFLKLGQNLPFEYGVLNWSFGIRIWNLYSTDLAERVIQAGCINLKQYSMFSMESIMARYFGVQIDKSDQGTFNLCSPLTQKQIEYAALDTRMPFSMKQMQMRVLVKDQLTTTAQIENDAIGTYVDMHLIGQRLNCERWMKRVEKVKVRRVEEIKELDKHFIEKVGRKDSQINYAELARLEKVWKEDYEASTPEELALTAQMRQTKDSVQKAAFKEQRDNLVKLRKEKKAQARIAFNTLSKEKTKALAIIEDCEGEAYLNYGSNKQLLTALQKFKGMGSIDGVGDDVLLKFNDRDYIQTLRSFKKGDKEIGTYGEQWTRAWITKPCKEEGFLHPGDGRLHCLFNQLEAETGRSSSSKPNAMNLPKDDDVRACFICDPPDAEEPEGYVIVTVDMSGAELRIIAELAHAQTWITAFAKGWDVHSVSTEILEPQKWPALACKGGERWFDPEKNKEVILPPCAYYEIKDGEQRHAKCKCPGHVELRQAVKSVNFLLCYGGGPDALADELGITTDQAKELMKKHEAAFPDVWGYLKTSGELAQQYNEARDMYGRRRQLPEPTYQSARDWYMSEHEEDLRLPEEDKARNIFAFKAKHLRSPNKAELAILTHSEPEAYQIKQAMRALHGSIGRRGKNHCIQGTNASIIKRAMGCGFDSNQNLPFLWHTLGQFKARIQNMVHDELVLQCPKRYGKDVAALVGDAFKRAAAEVMHLVVMEHDAHIADRWLK